MENETLFDYIKPKLKDITEMPLGILALCPFHRELSPSFYLSARKQAFECYSCGREGASIEAFDNLMKESNV